MHLLDPAQQCSADLEHHDGPAGPILVLHLLGEIDLLTIPIVQNALSSTFRRPPVDLVVDLAGVRFCGVRGFTVLEATADTARAAGIGYSVAGLSPHLDRVATLLWAGTDLVRHRSTAAAVTALRVDQTYQIS